MNDLWVYVGEGIGVYFEIFLAGENVPGVWEEIESVMECWDGK